MNKKMYMQAFSDIHPSDEVIERIMSMIEKRNKNYKKVLAVCFVSVLILCSLVIGANAATDGGVLQTVEEVVESVSNRITVLVNGRETDAKITVEEEKDADGKKYWKATVEVEPDGDTINVYSFNDEGENAFDFNDINIVLQKELEEEMQNK